jgi:hypothetical protein
VIEDFEDKSFVQAVEHTEMELDIDLDEEVDSGHNFVRDNSLVVALSVSIPFAELVDADEVDDKDSFVDFGGVVADLVAYI